MSDLIRFRVEQDSLHALIIRAVTNDDEVQPLRFVESLRELVLMVPGQDKFILFTQRHRKPGKTSVRGFS
jgi:hypothetical protein